MARRNDECCLARRGRPTGAIEVIGETLAPPACSSSEGDIRPTANWTGPARP